MIKNLLYNFRFELILLLFLTATARVLNFNGLYGQDAHEYLKMLGQIELFFTSGNQFSSPWFPILFPLTAFLVSKFLLNGIIALQAVSILALTFSFYYLKKFLQLLFQNNNTIPTYLFLLFGCSPYVFRFGLLSMSDALCMWFTIAAFYFSFKLKSDFSQISLISALLYCGAAMATRYVAALVIIFPIAIIINALSVNHSKSYWNYLAIPLLLLPLVPDYILTGRILFFNFNNITPAFNYGSDAYEWQIENFFKRNFESADGSQQYQLMNLLFVFSNLFHPAFLFAGIVFIFFIRRNDFKKSEIKILAAAVLLYAFYLAGLRYQNMRYPLLTFPFILIAFYPAFNRLMLFLEKRMFNPKYCIPAAAVIQVFLFAYSFQSIYNLNKTERNIAAALKELPRQNVYTTSITGALHSYNVKDSITDLYNSKIKEIQLPAVIVFNDEEFSTHFANRNPMLNYRLIQKQFQLVQLDSFNNGWKIYQIKSK